MFGDVREAEGGVHVLGVVGALRTASTTVVAVDVVGLSYKQAARALGTREGTIMSRL